MNNAHYRVKFFCVALINFFTCFSFAQISTLDNKFKLIRESSPTETFILHGITDLNSIIVEHGFYDVVAGKGFAEDLKISENLSQVWLSPVLSINTPVCLTPLVYNCVTTYSGLRVSSNEAYSYYFYTEKDMSSTLNPRLIISRLINGGIATDVLVDFTDLGFSDIANPDDFHFFSINSKGEGVIALHGKSPSTGSDISASFRIDSSGNRIRLEPGNHGGFFGINDLGVIFRGYEEYGFYKIVAYFPDGTTKNIISSRDIPKIDYRNFFVTNIKTETHPEGLIYSRSSLNNNQIVDTDGNVIFDLDQFNLANNTNLGFYELKVNMKGDFFWIGYDYTTYKMSLFHKNQPVPEIKTGDILYGRAVGRLYYLQVNNSGGYSFTDSGNPGESLRIFLGSVPKTCSVSDKSGRDVQFFSQFSGDGSKDLYAFHKVGEYANLEKPKPDVLMKDAGCVTTSLVMLFDFFGFKTFNNNLSYIDNYQKDQLSYSATSPRSMNILFRGVDDIRSKSNTFVGPVPQIKTYDANNDVTYFRAAEAIRGSEQLKCFKVAQSMPDFVIKKDTYIKNCIQASKYKISYIGDEKGGHKIFNIRNTRYLKPYTTEADKAARLEEERQYYTDIEKEICDGNPVLLRVARDPAKDDKGKDKPIDGHTVLVTESFYDENKKLSFYVNNPGRSNKFGGERVSLSDLKSNKDPKNGYKYTIGYEIFRPKEDPSMILVKSSENMDFVLTDNLGRRAGFDPTTQTEYREIPHAVYSYVGIEPNTEDDAPVGREFMPHSMQLFLSDNVQSGDYQIKTFGLSDGPGFLTIFKTDVDGFTNDEENYNFNVVAGEQKEINFKHTVEPLPIVNSNLIINFSRYETNNIKIHGELKTEDGIKITCNDQIKINIGSTTDYNISVSLSLFKKKIFNGINFYEHKTAGYKIIISENGMFWLELNNLDLGAINEMNKGKVSITVNNYVGRAFLNLSCNNNICSGDQK